MAETDDVPGTRKVRWRDRDWHLAEPTPEQITAIYRMSRLRPSEDVSVQRQLRTLNRVPALLESLMPVEEEWDEIEEDLAAKRVTLAELIDPITDAIRAWSTPEPTNRATKRAAAKKTTTARRL